MSKEERDRYEALIARARDIARAQADLIDQLNEALDRAEQEPSAADRIAAEPEEQEA